MILILIQDQKLQNMLNISTIIKQQTLPQILPLIIALIIK